MKNKKNFQINFDPDYPFEDSEFKQYWKEWVDYRKTIRKPYKTPRQIQLNLQWFKENKLTLQESIFVIKESIRQGWQGLFIPFSLLKQKQNGATQQQTKISFESIIHESNRRDTEQGY